MADSSNVNDFNLDQINTIEIALQSNQKLNGMINAKPENKKDIDVSIAMKNLQNVGTILKVAYAGSKGFKCSISVIKMLSKYQNLIKNSSVALSLFVETCLSALNSLQFTLMLAEMDELDESLNKMLECASLAGRLIIESEKLITEAGKLCELSEQSLEEATEDFNATKNKQNVVQKTIDNSRDKQKQLKEKQESYVKKINEHIETQKELTVKADNVREQDTFLYSTTLTQDDYDMCESQEEKTEDALQAGKKRERENQYSNFSIDSSLLKSYKVNDCSAIQKHKQLNEKKKEENEVSKNKNKEIVEENVRVKKQAAVIDSYFTSFNKEDNRDNNLATAIISLELVKKELGKVKVTFEQTKKFWQGFEVICKIPPKNEENVFFKDMLIEKVKENGLNWLALGKINNDAKKAIKDVDKNSDSIMSNLPTEQEAIEIMKNAKEILASFPQ